MRLDLLDMLGAEYMMDAIVADIKSRQLEEVYRVYVTDGVMAVLNFLGAKVKKRYFDFLHPTQTDGRSAEEITLERLTGFGIEVID